MSNVVKYQLALQAIFEAANKRYCFGTLEQPEITIQSEGRGNCYGWITIQKVWAAKEGKNIIRRYEINICAEHLNRTFFQVITTLLHEMAHLYNLQHGIRDVSSFQYHNKKFKEAAEQIFCLEVIQNPGYGYSQTKPTSETRQFIETLYNQNINFAAFRDISLSAGLGVGPTPIDETSGKPTKQGKGQKTKMKKWSCGCTNVRCAVELNAECTNCGNEFLRSD